MESTRQQQEGLYQDHLPHELFTSLEGIRVDSPVTLDQLARFFNAFDDIWHEYQHKTISETTASGGEDAWARILSTSSPNVFDSRKQHALSTLEPCLVDCDESLMNSVSNLTQLLSCADKSCTTNGWRILFSITGYLSQCDKLEFDMDFSDIPLSAVSPSPSATTTLSPLPSPLLSRFITRLGEPGSDEEGSWPSHGVLVPVTIISFEELCGLWERVLSRLSTAQHTQLGWRMNSESYRDAIRVLTALRDRWGQLMEDDSSSAIEGDVAMSLPLTTSMSKVLTLLDQTRDRDFAGEDIHTVPQPPPQDMNLGLDLRPPAKLELDLSLHLDLNQGLGRKVDEVQDPAAILLPKPQTFDEAHSDDSLYDPNEWFVSLEEGPVPRDVIMVNSPKIRHRILPSADMSKGQGETVTSFSPPGNLDHESTPSTHYSSPIEPPTPMVTTLPSGKMLAEGLMPSWLETLREQQEQSQQHLLQQIENLQQQLESIQLQYDQQHKRLTTLEQNQEPRRLEQIQLRNQLQDWEQQNKQAEWDRQEQMEDMQEQLLWQQQQLSNWEDLRQEGVWVQQSDFERLELQFERLHQLQKQQLHNGVGVKQSDFERLELQLERLQRQQKQQQLAPAPAPAPAPTSPPSNSANVQQQRSSKSSDQKKFLQLVADHHQLETKYRHLKQEFDRQAEKQRRQWERQQQIEHQLTKHQGIIQGHKQQVRQLNSDQKSRTTQYIRRIEELEEQLAQLQEAHDSLAVSSKASAEEPSQTSLEETPSQEQPVEDPVPPQPSSNKQSATTSTPRSPLSRIRTRRMIRSASSLQDNSTSNAGSANRGPGPSDAAPAEEEVADVKQSDSNEDSEPAEPEEESADNNRKVDEKSAGGSDSETEAKDETDVQSTLTKVTRSVRRSRRHNGGGESEVTKVSVVADPIKDYGVRRRSTVKRTYTKQAVVVRDPPRFRREQRRYQVTTSEVAIGGETKLKAAVESEEESEREREEETETEKEKEKEKESEKESEEESEQESQKENEKESEEESEKESEKESDQHENSNDEEKKEEEEVEERRVLERTPVPNTKVLRSRKCNNATITAASTVTMNNRRAMKKEVMVEHKQEEKTTATAPARRLPLLPRITRGSQVNNSANIHTNTNNASTNKIENTTAIHISTSNDDVQAKENPRKRIASGSHEEIAKRRLRSLRSAGFIEATTRTRSSGPVRTYSEMLGPSAPKDLRIR